MYHSFHARVRAHRTPVGGSRLELVDSAGSSYSANSVLSQCAISVLSVRHQCATSLSTERGEDAFHPAQRHGGPAATNRAGRHQRRRP